MFRALSTPGGVIVVAVFVFLVGVGMVMFANDQKAADLGEKVVVGATASIWTVLQLKSGTTK